MSSKRDIEPIRRERIDVSFSAQEKAEYRSFLESTGRKAGPWVKALILDAMSREKGKKRRAA
jgi:hypothetical protein